MAPNRWPDGPLPSGTPYADLPITDSHCMNSSCDAFAAGYNESYKDTSLISQIDYGYWTLCYYLSWGVLFILANLIYLSKDYHAQRWTRRDTSKSGPSWSNMVVARYRSVVYRRFTGRLHALPSFGILALLSLSTVFFACLIFPEQDYLRSHFRFGSPPLSVRCALCISALMPLLIALGGKVNIVTVLTGICYTKLNILHRYVGGVIFALSTIHMVPHIYAPIKDGGFDYLAQLYINQKRELSGTILYFLFLVLIALSIPWVRRTFYEFFVYAHIFLGVSFIGILAWHINGEYIAPIYLYVTLGILLAQTTLRLLLSTRSLVFLAGYPTTLEPLPGAVTKVRVLVPPTLRWRPGSHAFLRMPAVSVLDNHPFTIASVPSTTTGGGGGGGNALTFLIRTHAGFTKHLAALAATKSHSPPASPFASPSASTTSLESQTERRHRDPPAAATTATATATATTTTTTTTTAPAGEGRTRTTPTPTPPILRTLIDGPHARGSRVPALHTGVDTVVLVAGGTGVTAAVPWLAQLSRQMARAAESVDGGGASCRVGVVRLVWVVREAECVEWIRGEVEEAVGAVAAAAAAAGRRRRRRRRRGSGRADGSGDGPRVVVDVYATRGRGGLASGSESEVEVKREGGAGAGAGGGRMLPAAPAAAYRGDGDDDDDDDKEDGGVEEGGLATVGVRGAGRSGMNVHFERPNIGELLPAMMQGRRAFVLGCGPEGLKTELSNAVARLQTEMVVKSKRMESIALHTETFGW